MIKKNQKRINRMNALTDGIIIILAYLFSAWFWLDVIRASSPNMAAIESFYGGTWIFLLGYACFTVFLLSLLGCYHTSRIQSRSWRYAVVLGGNTLAVAAAAVSLYIFRLEDFSRGVLAMFYACSSLGLVGKRMVALAILFYARGKGYNLKHFLVVGGGKLAQQYVQSVKANPNLGLHVKAQLIPDDNLLKKLDKALRGSDIDEVILALNADEIHIIADVLRVCEKNGTKASVVPFYNDLIPFNPTIDHVGAVKLIHLYSTPMDVPFHAFCKRAMDLVGSGILLILLSPVFLFIAIGTKLSSPGPVIFRQERVGLNKRNFTMYKFRSMRVNSTQDSAWSTKSDNRRTVFGSILRKTSLDELPQLWNVFIGDMSMVGPRPEIPHYVEQFRETVPRYMVKYQVRPGMTGWAQIHGLRGDTSIPDRVAHDLWYIEHWSVWLDIKILFKTAFGGMMNDETIVAGKK